MVIFNSFFYVYQRVNLHFPMVFLWFFHIPMGLPGRVICSKPKNQWWKSAESSRLHRLQAIQAIQAMAPHRCCGTAAGPDVPPAAPGPRALGPASPGDWWSPWAHGTVFVAFWGILSDIWRSPLRSGSAQCDSELAVQIRGCWGRRRRKQLLIKSRDPHLAGGETCVL